MVNRCHSRRLTQEAHWHLGCQEGRLSCSSPWKGASQSPPWSPPWSPQRGRREKKWGVRRSSYFQAGTLPGNNWYCFAFKGLLWGEQEARTRRRHPEPTSGKTSPPQRNLPANPTRAREAQEPKVHLQWRHLNPVQDNSLRGAKFLSPSVGLLSDFGRFSLRSQFKCISISFVFGFCSLWSWPLSF